MNYLRQKGFTLVELMVVGAVTAVIAAMGLGLYQHGLLVDSEQSRLMRVLTTALHSARMRALDNQNAVAITNGQAINYNSAFQMYSQVQFTAANHGFSTGDFVTFTGLDQHAGMNTGTFYVTVIDANTFTCQYYTLVTANDTTGTARSVSQSSLLTFIKQSANPTQDQLSSNSFFIYNDTNLTVWDGTGLTPGTPAFTAAEQSALAQTNYTVTVAFNSRGNAASPNGYLLVVDHNPPEPTSQRFIRVFPSGRIQPGT